VLRRHLKGAAFAMIPPVHITKSDDFFLARTLDGPVAHLADADDGDTDFRLGHRALSVHARGRRKGAESDGFEELAAGQGWHG
jgi:hypothetical protein